MNDNTLLPREDDFEASLKEPLLDGSGEESKISEPVDVVITEKTKPVTFNCTQAGVNRILEYHGVRVIPAPTVPVNYHPTLAYERNTLQHKWMRKLHKHLVCDVGGTPSKLTRFNKDKFSVFHLCPQLQPGDVRRASGGNTAVTCLHTLEQHLDFVKSGKQPHPYTIGRDCCDKPSPIYHECHVCQIPDTYLLCHSAYYISAENLVEAIKVSRMKRVYVIGHVFDMTPGNHTLYDDEARYNVGADGMVIFQANGNRHLYRHKPLPWNDRPTFVVNDIVYEAVQIDKMGVNYVWEVLETQYPVEPNIVKPLDWRALLLDDTHVGEIQTTLDERLVRHYVNEPMKLDFNRFIGAGPFLIAFSDNRQLRVPRGAIAEVSSAVVGKERNPLTFTLAMQVARGYVKSSSLPVEERPQAIIAAAIIGFSLHIDFEVNMLDTARYRFSGWWSRHGQSLKLGALKAIPISMVIIGLVLLDMVGVIVDHITHIHEHPFTLIGLVLSFCFAFYISIVYCIQRRQQQDLAETFGEVRLTDGVGVEVSDPLPIFRLGVPPSSNFTPLADLETGSSVVLGIDPKPPKGEPKPTLVATGIITPTSMPVTAPSTQQSEENAIRNRVTAVNKNKMTDEMFVEYKAVFEHHPDFVKINDIHVYDDEVAFDRWLSRSPYNQDMREKLKVVWKKVVTDEVTIPQKIKAHVKSDEKLLKTGLVNTAYSARIISATSDEHKVATGPFMWGFSNALAKLWDGVNTVIYYVRGQTAEDVGSWMGAYITEMCGGDYSNILAYEDDFVKFDSSVTKKHQIPVRDKWRRCGAGHHTLEAFEHEKTSGSTRHGVKYVTKEQQIASGRNDTNVKGSMVNAAVHIAAIKPVIHEKHKDRMAVNGDDNLLLRSPLMSDQMDSVEVITERLQDLGMRPAIFVRRHIAHVEFCSKIFLESARHPGQWVLSPKPGRAIAKLGWTFTTSGETLRNDALSLAKDAMHVPFLRHIVRRTLLLAPKSTGVRKRNHTWEWEIHAKDYHDRKDGELPQSTWDIFYQRYGLTRDDEKMFETCCNAILTLPAVIPTTHISRLQEVDCPV